ncbi:MAG: metallophosphoesterase, partial [Nitrososphaeraceae archaeon]
MSKSSYAIKHDKNDEEFDYIFDPGQYIEYEEEETTNDNLNNMSENKKHNESIINKIKDAEITNKNNTIINDLIKKPNDTISTNYNFIAVGDWYCNDETKKTINNILAIDPELIITTGDQVKESPSAKCWIQMSEPLKDKMKIAIGNHDAEFANIYKQI